MPTIQDFIEESGLAIGGGTWTMTEEDGQDVLTFFVREHPAFLARLPEPPVIKVALSILRGDGAIAVAVVRVGTKHTGHHYAFYFDPGQWEALLAGSYRADLFLLDDGQPRQCYELTTNADTKERFADMAYRLGELEAGDTEGLVRWIETRFPTPGQLMRFIRKEVQR